jgi:signal transduction histidine kinase/CheY-like chemotaxis protein
VSESAASLRIVILAPIGRDAELMCTQLRKAGMECVACDDMETLCHAFEEGAGALLFTEEALTPESTHALAQALAKQPPWSEVPVLILAGLPSLDGNVRTYPELRRSTSLTLIDRPVRIQSLISATQSALTARKRQYETRKLMEMLEARVHERDRFLAILGHELRNPLGAILLASQMADSDGKLDAEHVRLIERQARHLTRIVNDLLDLSRVVSGKIVVKPEVVDLRRIAEQSLQMLDAAAKRQQVSVELQAPEQPLRVSADPVRADQILTNVVSNAIKYTPAGGHVRVTVSAEQENAVVRVEDDGVGIAPDRIGSIFELFAQAENAIGRSQGGMGIGLALVRNLVELQGGTVSASSNGIGKGSAFTIRLPLATAPPRTAEAPKKSASRPAEGRRIVIVEDNDDVRELLGLKLRRMGHTVKAACDGRSGVDTILSFKPDLALIDIGLPQLDGYQVASHVRSQLGDGVVLVAVSGFGLPEDKRKAAEAGFDEHITKPADVQEIESLLGRLPPRVRNVPEA